MKKAESEVRVFNFVHLGFAGDLVGSVHFTQLYCQLEAEGTKVELRMKKVNMSIPKNATTQKQQRHWRPCSPERISSGVDGTGTKRKWRFSSRKTELGNPHRCSGSHDTVRACCLKPCFSRKWATLFRCSFGIVGKTLEAGKPGISAGVEIQTNFDLEIFRLVINFLRSLCLSRSSFEGLARARPRGKFRSPRSLQFNDIIVSDYINFQTPRKCIFDVIWSAFVGMVLWKCKAPSLSCAQWA